LEFGSYPKLISFLILSKQKRKTLRNILIGTIGISGKSPIFANSIEKTSIQLRSYIMAKVCDITGKRPQVGNNVSHANNKTKRKFYPNLHKKSFYIPEEDAWITLKVCTKALRTINKKGITPVLREAQAKGYVIIK
jgi:large subunit ribosomal protein L28